MNPNFAVAEQEYIVEFDIEANGYNHRVGPCLHHTYLEPGSHPSGWVPLDDVPEERLHVDARFFESDEADETDEADEADEADLTDEEYYPCILNDKFAILSDKYGGSNDDDHAEFRYLRKVVTAIAAAKALREQYPTDAWGVELRRLPRDSITMTSLHWAAVVPNIDEMLRDFRQFPGIIDEMVQDIPGVIGAHKYVEIIHPKACQVRLLCPCTVDERESHGKRGRKKRKPAEKIPNLDRQWRIHQLDYLSIAEDPSD